MPAVPACGGGSNNTAGLMLGPSMPLMPPAPGMMLPAHAAAFGMMPPYPGFPQLPGFPATAFPPPFSGMAGATMPPPGAFGPYSMPQLGMVAPPFTGPMQPPVGTGAPAELAPGLAGLDVPVVGGLPGETPVAVAGGVGGGGQVAAVESGLAAAGEEPSGEGRHGGGGH
jgi:hypothetical protein